MLKTTVCGNDTVGKTIAGVDFSFDALWAIATITAPIAAKGRRAPLKKHLGKKDSILIRITSFQMI